MPVKWYGERLRKFVEAKGLKNMTSACLFLEKEIKGSLGGSSPSAPGEPPGIRTGTLRRSITHEVEKTSTGIVGRVGTNVKYAPHLEFGTSKMAARPFIRPKFAENEKRIAKILTSGR